MNNYDAKELFDKKMRSMNFDDDELLLSLEHRFLKMAISETVGVSECDVGNFELPARRIKLDAYYDEEDEKIFHLVVVLFFPDYKATEGDFISRFEEAQSQITNFILASMGTDFNSISSTSTIYEAAVGLRDAYENGYSVLVDYYSNLNFPKCILEEQKDRKINKVRIQRYFYGCDDIYEYISSNETSDLMIDLNNDFNTSLYGIKIASNKEFDIYLTSISGRLLAKIYEAHKNRLLEGNVRSYLKRTQKTNSGIVKTLQNTPSEFVAYNNGLSTVASFDNTEIKQINGDFVEIKKISQLQIVNGGQTTVTIYECFKDPIDLSDVIVPLKLAVLKRSENEAEMVSNISRFANTQTSIAKSDLSSNEPFYKQMEKLSRSIPCYKDGIISPQSQYYWYFERSNGQYNTEKRVIYNYSKSFVRKYPDNLKFSKKILAKAIMAFQQKPHIVCLGNEKNFVNFNNYIIENNILPNETYYKRFIGALILWRSVDKIILKLKLPIKAAVLPYTIAKLSFLYKTMIDLDRIWKEQKIEKNLSNIASEIAKQISEFFQDNIIEQPNTLMWGRKEECWDKVKTLPFNISDNDLSSTPINFLPQNPASKFIDMRKNLVDYNLWNRILLWNNNSQAFTIQQEKTIKDFINNIRISMGTGMQNTTIKKMKDLFMKAVRNGFQYKESI